MRDTSKLLLIQARDYAKWGQPAPTFESCLQQIEELNTVKNRISALQLIITWLYQAIMNNVYHLVDLGLSQTQEYLLLLQVLFIMYNQEL